jgi:hypothetical protein
VNELPLLVKKYSRLCVLEEEFKVRKRIFALRVTCVWGMGYFFAV